MGLGFRVYLGSWVVVSGVYMVINPLIHAALILTRLMIIT